MTLLGRHGLLLIAPTVLLLVLIVLAPELWALVMSFNRLRLGGTPTFIGWLNYQNLITDPRLLQALVRNAAYVIVTLSAEVLLAVPAALLMAKRFRFQSLWIALIIAPYAVSNVVGVTMWRNMLLTDTGTINNLLSALDFSRLPWLSDPDLAQLSVVLVSIWREFPFVFMIVYAAVLAVPQELREAAAVDGASSWQTFRHVVLPIIMPALAVAIVFRIVFAFRQFDIVWLLTQGGPGQATELLSIFLYRTGFRYWNIGEASALAWIMAIGTLLLAFHAMKSMYAAMWRARTSQDDE